MNSINQALTIKSVTIKNRLGMSPMCQYSAVNGFANDWHYVHYGTRAVGGVGLIMVEATAVAADGRITPYDLGLWNDNQIIGLQKIANFVHQQGSVGGVQIAHAGRKASHDSPANGGKQLSIYDGGWHAVAPSPLPFDPSETEPDELTKYEIDTIIDQFKSAALRVSEAGFRVLEIHGAHGYLVHEFLSPLSNKRVDEYGGSFENRIRFLLEIVNAVQEVWPSEFPLFVRLSATDWAEGGWDLDETVKLSKILLHKGIDLIDCSSGGNIYNAKIPVGPGYQVHFSEEIKKIGILTSSVGLINTTYEMSEILENGKSDLIFLGRELLRNPYFALKLDSTKNNDNEWPIQYLRAK